MTRVYFIKPIGMDGPIKIGCSFAPSNRKASLETWSPFPLEIIAEIDGDFRLERRFHAAFLDDHCHHEWFRVSPRLSMVIAEINAGEFDIDTLPEALSGTTFRKPRDNSFNTPEWRYSMSATARVRNIPGHDWNYWVADLRRITGGSAEGKMLDHRAEIEALIERVRERATTFEGQAA